MTDHTEARAAECCHNCGCPCDGERLAAIVLQLRYRHLDALAESIAECLPPGELSHAESVQKEKDGAGRVTATGFRPEGRGFESLPLHQRERDRLADNRLERAVVGALRAAINDHGPIARDGVGSAAKRIVGALRGAKPARPYEGPGGRGRAGYGRGGA